MTIQIQFKHLLLSTFLTIGLPLVSQASAPRCESIFNFDQSFENLTKYENLFTKGRGLQTYKVVLGQEFAKSFERMLLKPDAHWFDSGAGHAFAVRQALLLPTSQNLSSTVVAYETSAKSGKNLKVISGRFLENIADTEIPKSDLVTDVFGPLAYSGRPDIVLQKYLNNLKPDGEIYIFLGARHELYGSTNQIITQKGEVLSLGDWLTTLAGIKTDLIKIKKEDDGSFYEMWTIKITKENPKVAVPTVEMIYLKEGAPPLMTYKEVSSLEGKPLNRHDFSFRSREKFQAYLKNTSATDFFNAFRGGEIRHPLLSSLKSLKTEDLWVNSSEMNSQILSDLTAGKLNFSDTSVFTGLAQKFIRWRASNIQSDRIQYSSISSAAALQYLRNAKLITDFYGDFMSSLAPDKVLKKYVDALSEQGEVYIFMGPEYGGLGSESMVLTKDGRKVALRHWVTEVPGLRSQLFRGGYHWHGGEWAFVKLRIGDRKKIKIPELKFLGTTTNKEGLPVPYFEEVTR